MTQTCIHGNPYSNENPISAGWVISNDVVVHKFSSVTFTEAKFSITKPLGAIVGSIMMDKKISYSTLTIVTYSTTRLAISVPSHYDRRDKSVSCVFHRSLCHNHDNLDVIN